MARSCACGKGVGIMVETLLSEEDILTTSLGGLQKSFYSSFQFKCISTLTMLCYLWNHLD